MSHNPIRETRSSQPIVYQIRTQGQLGPEWTNWFEGMTITQEDDGDTLLTGRVVDQAALHGLLRKMRDLGMPLVSVNRVNTSLADSLDVKEQKEGYCNESDCS